MWRAMPTTTTMHNFLACRGFSTLPLESCSISWQICKAMWPQIQTCCLTPKTLKRIGLATYDSYITIATTTNVLSHASKNQKNKSKEQQANQLKSHRSPPCRFDFFHVVSILTDKLTKIRRRGKDVVDQPYIVNTTARNQFGLAALERAQPFSSASSDVGLPTMRCNNDFKYMPRGFADDQALVDSFRCGVEQLAACFQKL